MERLKLRFFKMFILGFKQLQDPYYQGFAAQVAFYLMLSIVPLLLLITQLLGFFDVSLESAFKLFEQYTGRGVSKMFEPLIRFSSVGFGNIVFIVIALWSASRASFAIMRITNYTLTEGRSTGGNYFAERFRAIRTMVITIFTIVFSLIILAYGKLILEIALTFMGLHPELYLENMWLWLRWVLGFGLYFLMVSCNYYILPTRKVPFKKVIPGSLFASAGMLIVTVVYARYANSLANYDVLYGALSSVVAVLFWFFLLAWVMFLGVLFNKVWDDTSDNSEREPFSKSRPPDDPGWRYRV